MKFTLEGIVILDLTRVIAGPFCTMLLADLGADVIKVEPPLGDDSRYLGPPFEGGESSLFISLNHNKRGMILDLTREEGKKVFFDLVKTADVVIENYRPGITKQLGIDYQSLNNINSKIIYCSITAFGETGPYRNRPGLDMVFQAISGLMAMTGEPGGRPVRAAAPVVDTSGGIMAALGIVAALYQREKCGSGQKISLPLLDEAITIQAPLAALYFANGDNPPRLGSGSPFTIAEDFKTADGYLAISIPNQKFWNKFCEILNIEHLVSDSRFVNNAKRVENRETLKIIIEDILQEEKTSYWLRHFEEKGIPCSEVKKYREVFEDPQVKHNGVVEEVKHQTAGEIRVTRNPLCFSQGRPEVIPPPLLGEHTFEILTDMGYSKEKIEQLEKSEVIKNKSKYFK